MANDSGGNKTNGNGARTVVKTVFDIVEEKYLGKEDMWYEYGMLCGKGLSEALEHLTQPNRYPWGIPYEEFRGYVKEFAKTLDFKALTADEIFEFAELYYDYFYHRYHVWVRTELAVNEGSSHSHSDMDVFMKIADAISEDEYLDVGIVGDRHYSMPFWAGILACVHEYKAMENTGGKTDGE